MKLHKLSFKVRETQIDDKLLKMSC